MLQSSAHVKNLGREKEVIDEVQGIFQSGETILYDTEVLTPEVCTFMKIYRDLRHKGQRLIFKNKIIQVISGSKDVMQKVTKQLNCTISV